MDESTSREKILKKVRNASMQHADNPYSNVDLDSDIYHPMTEELEVVFAEELQLVGGYFVYCESPKELEENLSRFIVGQQWKRIFTKSPAIKALLSKLQFTSYSDKDDLINTKVSITECEFLIARLGSVMVSSKQFNGRGMNFIPDNHIIIASRSQIVSTVKEAFKQLNLKYEKNLPSMTTLITGPSRTADIEKTLVMGAHGPRNLVVFLMEEDFLSKY
jgi:L-lactate dehydrogenase complex protein LldG